MTTVVSPTEAQFLKDISTHEMTVIRDDGQNRHIHCQRQNTRCMSFDVLTWPGHLCITGDMGSWLFARTPDMFEFFRRDGSRGQKIPINPGYWSEKILAADTHGRSVGGCSEFDADIFARRIKEAAYEHMRGRIKEFASHDVRRDFLEEVRREVIDEAENGEGAAYNAAYSYKHNDCLVFADFWEVNCRSYRHHFIWCLYAIVWTIQKYDVMRSEQIIEVAP